MIRTLGFEPSLARVRRLVFQSRVTLSLDAACAIADGIGQVLGGVLGEPMSLSIGEPVALGAAAWRSIAAHSLAFVQPARATDLVVTLPHADARRLIAAAFREAPATGDGTWSPLEAAAVERIVARAVGRAFVVGGELRGPLGIVDAASLPACVEYVDIRIAAPLSLTVGIALTRPLADPPPARTLGLAALDDVEAPVRAIVGHAVLPAARVIELRIGDVVPFVTKVAGGGELKVAHQRIALGTCGVVHDNAAFRVQGIGLRGKGP